MAWCHQATSHYLSQCWPRSMSPNGNTTLQYVKGNYSRVNVLELPRWEVKIALGNGLVLVRINIICIIHFSIVLLHAISEVELSATIYVFLFLQSFPALGALWSAPKQTAISYYLQWPELTTRAFFLPKYKCRTWVSFCTVKRYLSLESDLWVFTLNILRETDLVVIGFHWIKI